MAEDRLSLTEFTAWMAERGVVRSRPEWKRRMQLGQFGEKVGTQWTVTIPEAQTLLQTFLLQGLDYRVRTDSM